MPIYEYRCSACGHHLEALQKMSEGPLRKCPECGKSQLRRLVSASRFRLKGSGWYETDFKNKDEKQRNLVGSSESESKSDAGAETSAKTEAKKELAAEKSDGEAKVETPKAAKPATAKHKKPAAKPRASRAARR